MAITDISQVPGALQEYQRLAGNPQTRAFAGGVIKAALADPVGWVESQLDTTIYNDYNSKDYTKTQSAVKFLQDNGVSSSDLNNVYNTAVSKVQNRLSSSATFEAQSSGGGLGDILNNPVTQIALAYSLPGVGAALGAELGVSAAVGTALASTAVQVANGADFDTALKNATVTAIVTSGSPTVAKDIAKSFDGNTNLADALTSGGASIVSTLAKGGTMDDALKNATAAIAASGATQLAQQGDDPLSQQTSRDIGAAVGGALTGGVTGAITGLAGELGRPTTDSTSTKTATPATDVAPSENAPVDKVTDPVVAAEPPVATDTTAIPQTNYVAPPAVAPRDTTTDIQVVDAINKEKASTPVAPAIATTIPETKLDPVDVATTKPTPDISSTDVQVMDAIKKEATPAEPSVATTIPETKLPGVDVAATKPTPDISSTDVALLDAIKKETAPDVPVVPAKEVEPVTVTAPKPTPDIKSTDIQVEDTTQTPVDKAATPAEPAAETPAEPAPYKPDLFIYGGSGPSTLSQSLSTTFQAPYYPGAAPQGLTASRGAGEIEGVESGKKRKNVWNEASLRLKDALGL